MTSAVGIVIGLASRAPLTLFDEPYLGLDAVARQLFYDRLISDYAEHPRTVVLSTHLIEEISGLLEHVLLIDRGRVLLDADAESLRDSALTVTGPGDKVQSFARQHELLHTESLGGHSRAVVRIHGTADRRAAAAQGLAVEPTTLQQLVVAMSLQAPAARGPCAWPPPTTSRRSPDEPRPRRRPPEPRPPAGDPGHALADRRASASPSTWRSGT